MGGSGEVGGSVLLTRLELYELVWAEPIARIAERYHLSGAGFRKLCLRHDVPVPPRGYWARIKAGQKVRQPRLPKPGEAAATVRIRPGTPKATEEGEGRPEPELLVACRVREARAENRIIVDPEVAPSGEWVREAKRILKRGFRNPQGLLEGRIAGGAITLVCSEAAMARVLLIVSALDRAATRRKFRLEAQQDRPDYGWQVSRQRLGVEGVQVRLRLSEKTNLVVNKRSGKGEPAREYHPTGQLSLKITAEEQRYRGAERTVRDRPGVPLEEQLNRVMVVLVEVATDSIQRRADREEQQRKWQAERFLAAEAARKREQEAERLQALEGLAERWARAEQLRQFIAAVEAAGFTPGPLGTPEELGEWLDWARSQVALLDPLVPADNEQEARKFLDKE